MVKIYIDGKMYYAKKSANLLETCLSLGLNIPYFCWHPILGSLGACRQCAVMQYADSKDTNGRLIMSCMTPVTDNTIISINDDIAKYFRRTIIELLLTNHPHDCPVCEEGGNCHLQDMTVLSKHHLRNYRFQKRTHKNQYLGSFIKHEMNRCIGCYRCVRFYKDYADGTDFGVYGANNNIYFGRIEDGCLESEHSGNLIEICPTGVFTDKTHSIQYNRKWDMQYAPGICQNCSVGCNISIGERYGEIRRIENRYHESINHYLICDLGRFGYSHADLKIRPTNPSDENNTLLTFDAAIKLGVDFFKNHKCVIGVGSTRASLENNFALQELVGSSNFSNGMCEKEQVCITLILEFLKKNIIHTPSLKEIETYDVVLVIGEDLTQTSPRVALAVRQAIKNKAKEIANLKNIPSWNTMYSVHLTETSKNSLYILHTHESKLDDISEWCYYASVDDQVNFSCALAYELDNTLPPVLHLNTFLKNKVSLIGKKLITSKKSLIISGSHSFNVSIIKSAINIALSIKKRSDYNHVALSLLTPSSNTLSTALLGGMNVECALKKFQEEKGHAIIFMEYDLYRFFSKKYCDLIFKNKKNIMTIDNQKTETYKKSGLSLPSNSFAESSGTIINFEGRAQRFFQVYDAHFYHQDTCILESWQWLHFIQSNAKKEKISWLRLDDVIEDCIKKYPILKGIDIKELHPDFRIHGQKIARSPIRFSGRTSLQTHINIHEPAQPKDKNTVFSFSMEGFNQPDKSVYSIPFAWFPGWNSPQSWNKFQKYVGESLFSGDSGVHIFKKIKNRSCISYTLTCKNVQKKYWYVIPYYHIFGNEEKTQYSSVIKKNIPSEYALIGQSEALKIGLKEGSKIRFNCSNQDYLITVLFSKHLTQKQIGLPIGRKNFPIDLLGKEITHLQETY